MNIEAITNFHSAALVLGDDKINENIPISFQFRKPLHVRRQENALVTSNNYAASFDSPKFPVPFISGTSTLPATPVYDTETNKYNAVRVYADTTVMKNR